MCTFQTDKPTESLCPTHSCGATEISVNWNQSLAKAAILQARLIELTFLHLHNFAGSGDAQTLCISDDDNVWAWGDGDYGKLGRGGSDGCKIPMKIESLAGLGKCENTEFIQRKCSSSVYPCAEYVYGAKGVNINSYSSVSRPKNRAVQKG
jgi:E3 ubiquitin-protein ligase HERC2